MNRRDFCAGICSVAALSSCRCRPPAADTAVPAGKNAPPAKMQVERFGEGDARVVEVRWAEAVDSNGRVNDSAVRAMLSAAVIELGEGAFEALAGAKRRASIKVNSVTSQAFTHPELAAAVARGLVDAGSQASNVAVWDRDTAGLQARGYSIDAAAKQGYRCVGTDGVTHDKRRSITVAENKIYLSQLLTEADVLINIAALKDHSMTGVTLSLKNNFGMITGAERLHGNIHEGSGCEPGISELAAAPEIADRLQLAIIDGLVGVCEGGPGPASAAHVWRRGSLLLSADPVALDRRGLAIIEERRSELGLTPLQERKLPNPSPPIHIDNAAERLS